MREEDLDEYVESMIPLPGELKAESQDAFESEFRNLFSSTEASDAIRVVYAWVTGEKKPVHRLKGCSKIVYIGKTDQSLSQRHKRYAHLEAHGNEDCNWRRYSHIIREYGPISVRFTKVEVSDSPAAKEKELLGKYFDKHLELPPLNARN